MAPLVAETVMVEVPVLALPVAVSLRTLWPDPGATRVVGVKVAVIPLGNPVTEKATAALKPPLTVTVRVTLLFDPAVTETEFEEATA